MDERAQRWDRRLYAVLWIWVALKVLLPWLVFFRLTFEGPSYSWGTTYFGHLFYSSGSGTGSTAIPKIAAGRAAAAIGSPARAPGSAG